MTEPWKTCTKCNQTKPIENYYRTGEGDKQHSSCEACYEVQVARNKKPVRPYSKHCDICDRKEDELLGFLVKDKDRGEICRGCYYVLSSLEPRLHLLPNILTYLEKF